MGRDSAHLHSCTRSRCSFQFPLQPSLCRMQVLRPLRRFNILCDLGTGVCTNATAPSVSSINRILRNRAAERAAAEFARNYQLAAAATAASVHYPMPPPPPSPVHPFASAAGESLSLLNAHKCRKLKLIRCLADLLLSSNDTGVAGATSHHHHQLYAAWAAAAAAAFTGQHPSQHPPHFWPPIQAAAAAAEGLLSIDQVKKAGNDAGNLIPVSAHSS